MRSKGNTVHQISLPAECRHGTFVAPTLIEIRDIAEVQREVFGPVLHVLRYRREALDGLLESICATGYALTFGIHSRIDETVERLIDRSPAGNIYVNRSLIGAVVGVHPFGGKGLSGTGPKTGGPLYLRRLLATCPVGLPPSLLAMLNEQAPAVADSRAVLDGFCQWLRQGKDPIARARCEAYCRQRGLGGSAILSGTTGEENTYRLESRGTVLCVPATQRGACIQLAAALATGNRVLFRGAEGRSLVDALPGTVKPYAGVHEDGDLLDAVLFEGDDEALRSLQRQIAARPGPILMVQAVTTGALNAGTDDYVLERLLMERSISVNTAPAGNTALVMLS